MPIEAVAWIVAVEKYAGDELSIKQPVANWALDFAEIMLDAGVPKVVLSLSLNALPAYEPRTKALQDRGAKITGASQADILNALEFVQGSGTLFLYWVGHGIITTSRQLVCQDSKRFTDLRVIGVDSLLTHLRSPKFPRLQMGFMECCAQVLQSRQNTLEFSGDGNTVTRQFFCYAASTGEIASATTTSPGFSAKVLQALRSTKSLPPDPKKFFPDLMASLGELQSYSSLQYLDGSGDLWSICTPGGPEGLSEAAKVADLTLSQFDCLWKTVRRAPVTPIELARAFTDGKLPELAKHLHTLQPSLSGPDLLAQAERQLKLQKDFEPLCLALDLLFQDWLLLYDRLMVEYSLGKPDRLEDLPRILLTVLDKAPEENGLRLFIRLLLMAAMHAKRRDEQAAVALRKGLANDPRLSALYQTVYSKMPLENDRLYLLLELGWDPDSQTASLVKAWTSPGAESLFDPREIPRESNLADQINSVVEAVLGEHSDRSLIVELLAPNDLMCAPRKLLESIDPDLETSTWLEAFHAITVRWQNRMKGHYRCQPGSWKQRSEAARSITENVNALSCSWRPPITQTEGECHVVALSFAGPSPSEPRRNRAEFFDELKEGAPYMCWPRNPPLDVEHFKAQTADLLNQCQLHTLPATLRKRRSDQALGELILLIDEPDRNPYTKIDNLSEIAQRGSS